jgi:hypothetical protein
MRKIIQYNHPKNPYPLGSFFFNRTTTEAAGCFSSEEKWRDILSDTSLSKGQKT